MCRLISIFTREKIWIYCMLSFLSFLIFVFHGKYSIWIWNDMRVIHFGGNYSSNLFIECHTSLSPTNVIIEMDHI